MRIGLFIPCYVDQFYPQVGVATLRLLEHFNVGEIVYPAGQTCCGQPMANAGCHDEARPLADRFLKLFRDFDYVVAPSASCVAMVRHHYDGVGSDEVAQGEVQSKTFELCEFLHDIVQVTPPTGSFPHVVGLHQSCHGLRELRLGNSSEQAVASYSKVRALLQDLQGIRFAELARSDECCGFGGSFAVDEEAVSCMMGRDRITDHLQAGTEVLTAADMSCLMHMDGLLRRRKQPMRVMHVAELLTEAIGIETTSIPGR